MNSPKPNIICIAVADANEINRKGTALLVASFKGFAVTMEAGSPQELAMLLAKAPALPHICILKVDKLCKQELDAIKSIKARWPAINTLALTNLKQEYAILQLIKNGDNCCLQSGCGAGELEKALRALHEKNHYYSEMELDHLHHFAMPGGPRGITLTEREAAFLPYCCADYTYEEIAGQMHVSLRTVQGYRDSLLKKLKGKTRVKLIRFAIAAGLAPYDEW